MPTAVWTGTLSFGLVAVPVRLVPATEPKDVRFHLYDREGRRVRYERVVDPGPEGREEPEEPAASVVAPAHEREPEPEGPRRDDLRPHTRAGRLGRSHARTRERARARS